MPKTAAGVADSSKRVTPSSRTKSSTALGAPTLRVVGASPAPVPPFIVGMTPDNARRATFGTLVMSGLKVTS